MKQTAVEFIESEIKMSDGVLTKGHLLLIIDQVKEMEKERMSNAMLHGWRSALDEEVHSIDPDDFYNKTFKSE